MGRLRDRFWKSLSRKPSPSPSGRPSPKPSVSHVTVVSSDGGQPARGSTAENGITQGGPGNQPAGESRREGGSLREGDSRRDGDEQHGRRETPTRPVRPLPGSEPVVSGPAYRRAWEALDEKQKQQLAPGSNLMVQFQQMLEKDKQQRENSVILKGLHVAGPYLKNVVGIIDWASPFTGMDPTAGTAVGIVKSIAVAASGVCDKVPEYMERLVAFVPAMGRCDKLNAVSSDVETVLTNMYKALLSCYLEGVKVVTGSRNGFLVVARMLNAEFESHITEFQRHADTLDLILQIDLYSAVKGIEVNQLSQLGNDYYTPSTELHGSYSDEACSWIRSEPAFQGWASRFATSDDTVSLEGGRSPSPRALLVVGGMGCGKSVVSAYVSQVLSQEAGTSICRHFCRYGSPEAELTTILRSLLSQLLEKEPTLKYRFFQWYQNQGSRGAALMQNNRSLKEFLAIAIRASPSRVVLVIDGLDECTYANQYELLEFLKGMLDGEREREGQGEQEEAGKSRIGVFLSARPESSGAELLGSLGLGAATIAFRPSVERDRAVAEYLVSRSDMPPELGREVISVVSELAQGSAIWLRIAVAYLQEAGTTVSGVRDALQELLDGTRGLTDLYAGLFAQAHRGVKVNRLRLQAALEILAVAKRALNISELAAAVTLRLATGGEHGSSVAVTGMEGLLKQSDRHATVLARLIQPFVTAVQPTPKPGAIVTGSPNNFNKTADAVRFRLVHQSLRELLFLEAPERWSSSLDPLGSSISPSWQVRHQRPSTLRASLLDICIRYLLLDNCGAIDLAAKARAEEVTPGLLHLGGDLFDDGPDDEEEDTSSDSGAGPIRTFDPNGLGLGPLFAYAACLWTSHFADLGADDADAAKTPNTSPAITAAERGPRPDPRALMALCRPESLRLRNWVFQWNRPGCTVQQDPSRVPLVDTLDALSLAVLFGPPASALDLLQDDASWSSSPLSSPSLSSSSPASSIPSPLTPSSFLGPPDFNEDTLWDALIKITADNKPALLLNFLHNPRVAAQTVADWDAVFSLTVQQQRAVLLRSGNAILCDAAHHGCLPLIRVLFRAAAQDPALKTALLAIPTPGSTLPRGYFIEHQSIGLAAWEGHTDVVQFLLNLQPATTPHLYHRNSRHATVFHQWARKGCGALDLLRVLHRAWPEGLNLRNDEGDTPIVVALFNSMGDAEADLIDTLRALQREFGLDLSGRVDDREKDQHVFFDTPLLIAARRGQAKLCRFLVTQCSADLASVVGRDPVTKKPRLLVNAAMPGDQRALDEGLLKALGPLLG
ncbi:uncharacterized protein C8A04DRAFT_15194 [Dichotomopilus funicola]|uniref:Nephrocystin 3-like N-terminal domain-containing protein n=1 Tax=Dichotomopilus funicola TaxID=1934379 RepID=A0AAN6UVW2_9PEZI|nr:hypothetical protein C8A04DRAFT_15194 [Dichotomopilus funicola]